jgi:two-component system LytT family response regulator
MPRERAPSDLIRVLIADDEPLARDCVRDALNAHADVEVMAEVGDGHQAVVAIQQLNPDLVFLDVHMPGLDGFGVIDTIGVEDMPSVVLVTAFDQYALKAFDVHAIDYLLKPFDDERFERAMDEARVRLRATDRTDEHARLRHLLEDLLRAGGPRRDAEPYATRFTIREGEKMRFVPVNSVDYFEANGNNVVLHVGSSRFSLRSPLRDVVEKLDPTRFARIHRSIVVQLGRIREIQPWFGGDYVAILQDGRQLRISRTYRASVLKTIA